MKENRSLPSRYILARTVSGPLGVRRAGMVAGIVPVVAGCLVAAAPGIDVGVLGVGDGGGHGG